MTTHSLPIAEIFTSWQGEGMLTGTPAVFVRLAGCHLRCGFCDTSYAWDVAGAKKWPVEKLAAEVVRMAETPRFPEVLTGGELLQKPEKVAHVVITGGEPALFPAVVPLTETLKNRGFHLTIETSGTHYLPAACDLWSVSPKLRNAVPREPAARAKHLAACVYESDTLKEFTKFTDYQLKFVADTPADIPEIVAFLARFPFLEHSRVMLMPQGKTPEEIAAKEPWVQEKAQEHGFQVSPRAHLTWFGAAGRF